MRMVTVLAAVLGLGLASVAPPARAQATTPPAPPPEVRAWQTGALAPDRLQHASLAFSVGLGTGLVTGHPAAAAGAALTLGLGKELFDHRRGGRFDWVDLLADAAGAALAAAATAALD